MYSEMKPIKLFFKRYPSSIAILALLGFIIVGTGLLSLPLAQIVPMKFIDILFTSTSVATVTGLTTVPLQNFSTFGNIIILLMMQIGGIGLMTMSLFVVTLFSNMGIYTHVLARDLLCIESFKDAKRLLIFIMIITGISELIGTIVMFFNFYPQHDIPQALHLAVFHSVSAFCNAGITYLDNGIVMHNNNPSFMLITIFLFVIGGIGFITLYDLLEWWNQDKETEHYHISWHTKLIIEMFFFTTLFNGILLYSIERLHAFKDMGIIQTFLNVVLLSVSYKSAGLITIPISSMYLASLLLIMICFFIGSAPASTGSGIRLSNFGIMLGVMKAALFAKEDIEIHGRHISTEQVYRSMAIIMIFISWIITCTFCLLISEENVTFLDSLFESASAFCGSGLSLGLTKHLSIIGKIIIMLSMIAGRLAIFVAIMGIKRNIDLRSYSYPEEKVILG